MKVSQPYREFRKQNSLDSIWSPIDSSVFDAFPATVVWEGQTLLKKDVFHFTVLHVETACELIEKSEELQRSSTEEKITTFFNTFVAENPIKLISFQDDFRYAQKGERRTIVLRCIASNIPEFFAALNKKFNIKMPTQPMHVTLYTLQKNGGIHIPSNAVIKNLPKVSIPALDEVLKHVHI